ncbi:Solute carrier family 15 member 2 [Hypsibius exemplaris]|uniref:Solute carrier family 15 member 2 n=1 Tax=Hypsibius exemplaris TaxID=2072580 RepID=A0A9X6NDD4_HYPEX|nr:Solute carrier family 15 member 2 [Hypsibius exemplaris]
MESPSELEKASPAKAKYPWFIIFILGNEFCERFTYYGMKTVLTLYFSKVLLFSEDSTTFYYHFFSMLCYFFPIFGAWIADGAIGKFKTIFSLSVVYIIGLVVLTLSAIPDLHFHAIAGTLSGLLLIAIGTGGIKPCVAAYGADQFKPGQEAQRETFFSYFYFCINAGSLISTFVTPLLRSDVHCFGAKTCYSLAFGVPAALMAVALVLFLLGKPFYQDTPPTGSLISRVFFCIFHAIANNIRGRNVSKPRDEYKKSDSYEVSEKRTSTESWLKSLRNFFRKSPKENTRHWLDSASDKYDLALINDIKQLLRVLVMFLPIPMFWALFDQQGSRWTLQANKMDGRLTDSYYWQPDQVQIFNPVLILIFIPFFEWIFYPLLHKFKIPFRLLSRMVAGMILAGVAFIIAGFVQIALDKTLPVEIRPGTSELRIFNANPCSISLSGQFLSSNESELLLGPYEMKLLTDLPTTKQTVASFNARNINCRAFLTPARIAVNLTDSRTSSLYLTEHNGVLHYRQFEESKEKPEDGNAKVRFIIPLGLNTSTGNGNITMVNPNIAAGKDGHELNVAVNGSSGLAGFGILPDVKADVDQGRFILYLSNERAEFGKNVVGAQQLDLPNGGVYTVIIKSDLSPNVTANASQAWQRYDIVEPNTLSIFWQFPQYFVITLGEVFLSVSGLTFAYSEAPESMKSVLQAAWLLTSAFGSIIVMVFSGAHLIRSQAVEFFVFAGLIGAFAIIFAIMASRYRYKELDPVHLEMTPQDPKPGPQRHVSQDSRSGLITEAETDESQFRQ